MRVYEALHEYALTQTQRQILACLVRNGVKQQDPADWIFMKKVTIAQRLRLSEATVYRCLAALERVGLIEREEQRQTGYTLKVLGRIRLSGQAIRNLGLASVHPSREMVTIERIPDVLDRVPALGLPTLAPVRDVNSPPQQSSSKKQSPGASPFIRVQGKAVPSELAWLVTQNNLSLSGLFHLMKRAKLAGHRLSDVVQVVQDALSKLSGRELFAYLAALLAKRTDFAFVARQRTEEVLIAREAAQNEAARLSRVAELATALRGVSVVRDDGTALSVDEVSVLVIRRDGTSSSATHQRALDSLEEIARLVGEAAERDARRSAEPQPQMSEPRPSPRVFSGGLDTARAILGMRTRRSAATG
ncbi:hypothetical protein CF70_033865 [Cupriavidus sp. SK-3]|nr:hypothetical protein CF70_033865 [Cupriavidus sp. SK-3]